MQLVFMLSQFDANSYTYLCARVKDHTYVTVLLPAIDIPGNDMVVLPDRPEPRAAEE